MANHAGLQKVVKSVKGKKGTVHRSYWVNAAKAAGAAAGIQAAGAATHNLKAYAVSAVASQIAAHKIMGTNPNQQSFGRRLGTSAMMLGASAAGSAAGFVAGNALRMGAGKVAQSMRDSRGGPSRVSARVSNAPTQRIGRAPYQLHAHSNGGVNSNTHGY